MADIIGSTGFNYTKNWGSQLGQKGSFQAGSRPPAKTDWDSMSQEERDAVGVPTWDDWQKAQEGWIKRNQPGGDQYEHELKASEAIMNSGASDFAGIERALIGAGFDPKQGEDSPLFKRLAMAYAGTGDPSGRYHKSGNQWADYGTSDLSVRGIPGAAAYSGNLSGMDAIRSALPGFREAELFRDWNRGAGNGPGGKGAPGAGLTPIGNGFYRAIHGQTVDSLGYVYDPATGKRVGHYIPGSGADVAYGGRGMQGPTSPANPTPQPASGITTGEPTPGPQTIPTPLVQPDTNAWGVQSTGNDSTGMGMGAAGIGASGIRTGTPKSGVSQPIQSSVPNQTPASAYSGAKRTPRGRLGGGSVYGIYG